ncbi:hypothetical protein P12x_000531 [Tundrisphaera lichenicola]|uniref:hypothetical protein n=1 Tax=Tundrisphaera lichenicola TaxID=2029860 RepID=UPI003EB9A36C
MSEGLVDLWGDDFVAVREDSAPVALLKQQAEALTRRTNGVVEGIVQEEARGGTKWDSLLARVPNLSGYMHELVGVSYPVTADPSDPRPLSVYDTFGLTPELLPEEGVSGFRAWLEQILSSREAHKVIEALLRHGSDRVAS